MFSKYTFKSDGIIPNSPLPVLLYSQVSDTTSLDDWLESSFQKNGWTNNWRDIILPYDHFHSNTHEVIGILKGTVSLKIGGQSGEIVHLKAGDVIIIPAGVGHQSISEHVNYECVGGYPLGAQWDMYKSINENNDLILQNLSEVLLPFTDPIFGNSGPLIHEWKIST